MLLIGEGLFLPADFRCLVGQSGVSKGGVWESASSRTDREVCGAEEEVLHALELQRALARTARQSWPVPALTGGAGREGERKRRRTTRSPTEMVPARERSSRLFRAGKFREERHASQSRPRLAARRPLMAHWRPTLEVYRAPVRGFLSATAMYWGGGNCDTTHSRFIPRAVTRRRFDDERRRLTHDEVDAWRAGSRWTSNRPLQRLKDFVALRMCPAL